MTGLKNTSAKACGEKGAKLGEGKEPLPFKWSKQVGEVLVGR